MQMCEEEAKGSRCASIELWVQPGMSARVLSEAWVSAGEGKSEATCACARPSSGRSPGRSALRKGIAGFGLILATGSAPGSISLSVSTRRSLLRSL